MYFTFTILYNIHVLLVLSVVVALVLVVAVVAVYIVILSTHTCLKDMSYRLYVHFTSFLAYIMFLHQCGGG